MIIFGKEKSTGQARFQVPMYHFKNGTGPMSRFSTH